MAQPLPAGTYPEWNSGKVMNFDGDVVGDIADYTNPDGTVTSADGKKIVSGPYRQSDEALMRQAAGTFQPGTDAYTPDDIKRQQAQNSKEIGETGLIGALGSAAQAGLSAIPTAAQTRNNEQLANLTAAERSGRLGLSADDRAVLTHSLLDPVRAEATQARVHADNRLASMGNTSAGAQRAVARDAERATQSAEVAAGAQIEQAQIAERNRQRQELEDREVAKDQNQQRTIGAVGSLIGSLANLGGKVLGANATERQPYDAEITKAQGATDASGNPLYPELQGLTTRQARDLWSKAGAGGIYSSPSGA